MHRKRTHPCPPWETFKEYSLQERIPYFSIGEQPFHILYTKQFSRTFLDEIYILTNKIRLIAKTKHGKHWLSRLLENHRAMLYFAQPSTRTFLSFATACETMGMKFYDVRSLSTSSEVKGETFEDTMRTFSSYFDLLILRHSEKTYAERAAVVLNRSRRPIPLINAGSSKDEHPTQALLDIFTLRKSFEKLDGIDHKTIMMVGDLKRGRTVRSLSMLLTQFKDVKIIFCSPKELKIEAEVKKFLHENQTSFIETTEFEKNLSKVDALYMTRVQDEHDNISHNSTKNKDKNQLLNPPYVFTQKHLAKLKPSSIIMHPLPRKNEIDKAVDEDPRAMYWRQVRNGMWTRCALVGKIFGLEEKILEQ